MKKFSFLLAVIAICSIFITSCGETPENRMPPATFPELELATPVTETIKLVEGEITPTKFSITDVYTKKWKDGDFDGGNAEEAYFTLMLELDGKPVPFNVILTQTDFDHEIKKFTAISEMNKLISSLKQKSVNDIVIQTINGTPVCIKLKASFSEPAKLGSISEFAHEVVLWEIPPYYLEQLKEKQS